MDIIVGITYAIFTLIILNDIWHENGRFEIVVLVFYIYGCNWCN